MSHKLEHSHKKVMLLKKKLQTTQKRARRYKTQVNSLREVVADLKQKELITTPCEDMLNSQFSGVPLQLMKRMISMMYVKG